MSSASQLSMKLDRASGALGPLEPAYVNRALDQAHTLPHDVQLAPGASLVIAAHVGAVQLLLSSVPRPVRIEFAGGELTVDAVGLSGASASGAMTVHNDVGDVSQLREVTFTVITVAGRQTP